MVVKHLLQKGWCEPASGKENSLPDCCEGVGVLPSEGGNTSAYLETERYRSMPFQLSACHRQKGWCELNVGEWNNGKRLFALYRCLLGSDGSYSSLCSWVKGFDVIPPSTVSHPVRHGKVITDATLERQVSISPMSVSVASRLRMRFLPMSHCEESRSSEYCA